MSATFKVLALVARLELPFPQNLICFCLGFGRKSGIIGARVDEKRCFRSCKIFLENNEDRFATTLTSGEK